jgi:dihydrofolate synthase/folylpolyglutamate synthase
VATDVTDRKPAQLGDRNTAQPADRKTVQPADRNAALDFLYSRINYERLAHVPYGLETFKLERMRQLLARVGNPHLGLKAVHIAGTKGKGSTAAMIAAVLREAGYRTALYTSPHLQRLEERFVIDGCELQEREMVALAAELVPVVEQMDREGDASGPSGGLTFFEITTALGFLHFARHKVDIAVLEVGLGGRLDSTNVCQPDVSVITSISLDHTKQLGTTLAAIAREKAGIIKPGVPVISGVVEEEARMVIEGVAKEFGAPLVQRGRDFDFTKGKENGERDGERFDYWENRSLQSPRAGIPANGVRELLREFDIPLLGDHQCANAAVAIAALHELREKAWNISEGAIRNGLSSARCSSRIEILAGEPTVVLDVAHNVASVQALVDVLRRRFPGQKPTLIFASSRDKDVAGMMRVLLPACERLILTQYVTNPRAMELAELQSIAQSAAADLPSASPPKIEAQPTPENAWQSVLETRSRLICITGSFFLAADMTEVMKRA